MRSLFKKRKKNSPAEYNVLVPRVFSQTDPNTSFLSRIALVGGIIQLDHIQNRVTQVYPSSSSSSLALFFFWIYAWSSCCCRVRSVTIAALLVVCQIYFYLFFLKFYFMSILVLLNRCLQCDLLDLITHFMLLFYFFLFIIFAACEYIVFSC